MCSTARSIKSVELAKDSLTCPSPPSPNAIPEGALYAFPDISGTGMSSFEFADMLLSKARVAVTPGIAFGDSGEGHVRISFSNSTRLVEKAIERMREVL